MKHRLLIKCIHSLGDNVVLTAAVRDLIQYHSAYYDVNVDSSFPEVWQGFSGLDRSITRKNFDGSYLVSNNQAQLSNGLPYHYIMQYYLELASFTGHTFPCTAFHGTVLPDGKPHILTEVLNGQPYWLLNAGVKNDILLKGYPVGFYQEVIHRLKGWVTFVQTGSVGEAHPPLDGVIDLRGKTTVTELIRLMAGSSGVLCGVTGLMHLAAAVPTMDGRQRSVVVIGGGRESPHWVQYPGHALLHQCYQLPCCQEGGCWRRVPVGMKGQGKPCASTIIMDKGSGQSVGECMMRIPPDEVVDQVLRLAAKEGTRREKELVIPDQYKPRDWDCDCDFFKKVYPDWSLEKARKL